MESFFTEIHIARLPTEKTEIARQLPRSIYHHIQLPLQEVRSFTQDIPSCVMLSSLATCYNIGFLRWVL